MKGDFLFTGVMGTLYRRGGGGGFEELGKANTS